MGVLYGFEPLMIVIIMFVAKIPDARVVPDRTVLVPIARDSTDGELEDEEEESRHSLSSDESSVANRDLATQMHSTIVEEEHDENAEHDRKMKDQQTVAADAEGEKGSRRLSGMPKPAMRRMSTRYTATSGHTGERRGSDGTNHSAGMTVPRTPVFDPRNRRSTIILHEPLNLNLELERQISRRPSDPSHQMVLARTASMESRRNSYFSIVAAAAGSLLGPPSPLAAYHTIEDVAGEMDEKDLVPTQTSSSGELDDEKKAVQLADAAGKDDDVRIDLGSVTHPSLTESTALVIPCHNADVEVLKAVLFAALVHFEPW